MACNEFIVLGTVGVSPLPAIKAEEYPASVVEALSLNRTSFPEGFVFGTASAAYQEDIQIMKDMNLDAYRFSMSWSRIIPNGKVGANEEGVNQEGIDYYNRLIDNLIANGQYPRFPLLVFLD
ncbi:hypothetical protein LR48_Vigan2409s000100 [Vigna angularis]|nr:hypothetical protein LR48_Vigan2409s000100 [Vigna angularis]